MPKKKYVNYWLPCVSRLAEAKRMSGLSDTDLARAVSAMVERQAGRAQINHIFRGKREPTISQFRALCQVMGADPVYVMFGGELAQATEKPDSGDHHRFEGSDTQKETGKSRNLKVGGNSK